jgi:hypothetical protein
MKTAGPAAPGTKQRIPVYDTTGSDLVDKPACSYSHAKVAADALGFSSVKNRVTRQRPPSVATVAKVAFNLFGPGLQPPASGAKRAEFLRSSSRTRCS